MYIDIECGTSYVNLQNLGSTIAVWSPLKPPANGICSNQSTVYAANGRYVHCDDILIQE